MARARSAGEALLVVHTGVLFETTTDQQLRKPVATTSLSKAPQKRTTRPAHPQAEVGDVAAEEVDGADVEAEGAGLAAFLGDGAPGSLTVTPLQRTP